MSVPENWRAEKIILRFIVGPRDGYGSTAETQLYVNGFPLQAIDIWHEKAWLPTECGRVITPERRPAAHWRGMDGSEVLVTFFTTPGETKKNH